jgi:hypothetical protein
MLNFQAVGTPSIPEMTDPWVCIECGARRPHGGPDVGTCRCGHDITLDMHDEKVRELMRDIDDRLAKRRETRFRLIGVVVGMATIFGAWMIPGYWDLRGRLYPGLPFVMDQWLLMALIGLGLSKLLEKKLARRRFPYLGSDLEVT